MGTKNTPGQFDCYANAEPDEPMFILLGRDPVAWMLVDLWAAVRKELGKTSPQKHQEAIDCAFALEKWASEHGKDTLEARDAFLRVVRRQEKEARELRAKFGLPEETTPAPSAAESDGTVAGGGEE